MLGGQSTVRQSIYPADDGGGEELQGATATAVELTVVREELGEGVTECTATNPKWRGEGGTRVGGRQRQ